MFSKSRKALALCLVLGSALGQGCAGQVVAAGNVDAARDFTASQQVAVPAVREAGSFPRAVPTVIAADTANPTSGTSTQLSPGKKIGTGLSGQVKYGFNIHSFTMGSVGPMFQQVGAKVFRIPVSYSQYLRAGKYPGKNDGNAISQATVDAAAAAGLDVLLAILNPVYPPTDPSMAQWPAFVEAVVAANAKHTNVVFELGNEPNYAKITAQQYFDVMKMSYPAVKKGNPNAKLAALVINASYTAAAKKFIAQLMAMPGVFELFDFGDFHPYYNTPETSYFADLDAFIRSIDTPATKAGKSIEFFASEVGWSNATGVLAAIGGKARGTGETHLQTAETAADFYSRYIPITRATHKLRIVTFYSLVDEGPPDPDMMNVQAHFGVFVNRTTPKPSALVAQDLFPHVHAATGAEMFTRSGTADKPDTTADWFVRLDTPQNHELIAWTVVMGGRIAQIAVDAQQAGTLSIKIAGASSSTEVSLSHGVQVVNVPLGSRSVVLSSNVRIDFPEFK